MSAMAATKAGRVLGLRELEQFANDYGCDDADLPIHFSSEPYTRIVLHRDESMEVVLICFAAGQTSSVHDHRGSACVIRVLRGKILETLFEPAEGTTLASTAQQYLDDRFTSSPPVSRLCGGRDEAGTVSVSRATDG